MDWFLRKKRNVTEFFDRRFLHFPDADQYNQEEDHKDHQGKYSVEFYPGLGCQMMFNKS
jgi:hypothetical protein